MLDTQIRSKVETLVDLSPDVILDTHYLEKKTLFIARDDLLPGGSKQRACASLLQNLVAQGYTEFVYASPFCGFAQVALAYACSKLGLKCFIFCEESPDGSKHAFTKLAEFYGAKVSLVDSLSEAEVNASLNKTLHPNRFKIPLGFNCDEFKDAFEVALHKQWDLIIQKLGGHPKRLWLPVGSGTLASVFTRIVNHQTTLKCVNINIFKNDDARFDFLLSQEGLTLSNANERFHDPAEISPAIPSNIHYDAKIWRFLQDEGQDGDVWWNVAR